MIAVDTSVVVRYLVEDDVDRTDRAERVLASGFVFVPKTVVVETAWILTSSHRYDRAAVDVAIVAP